MSKMTSGQQNCRQTFALGHVRTYVLCKSMQPMVSVVLVEFRTFSLSSCVSALYLFDAQKELFLSISSVLVCIYLCLLRHTFVTPSLLWNIFQAYIDFCVNYISTKMRFYRFDIISGSMIMYVLCRFRSEARQMLHGILGNDSTWPFKIYVIRDFVFVPTSSVNFFWAALS